jgi:hypothetical protein
VSAAVATPFIAAVCCAFISAEYCSGVTHRGAGGFAAAESVLAFEGFEPKSFFFAAETTAPFGFAIPMAPAGIADGAAGASILPGGQSGLLLPTGFWPLAGNANSTATGEAQSAVRNMVPPAKYSVNWEASATSRRCL